MRGGATPARRAALEVFDRVRAGELADRALEQAAAKLEPRDRAWTQELVYGTFRLRGRIDYLLGALVRGGVDRLDPEVCDVLRLGAYQLLEMGSVPPYAAVSQSVELARADDVRAARGLAQYRDRLSGAWQSVRAIVVNTVMLPRASFHIDSVWTISFRKAAVGQLLCPIWLCVAMAVSNKN